MQKFILSDIEKCTGCGRCTLACSAVKEEAFVPAKSRIHFVNFPRAGLSIPNVCFHCENPACAEECPVDAIQPDTEPGLDKWLEINTEYAEKWPNITMKKDPMPDADSFDGMEGKFEKFFSVEPGEGD